MKDPEMHNAITPVIIEIKNLLKKQQANEINNQMLADQIKNSKIPPPKKLILPTNSSSKE
jgi:SAM-dependent MidA family methyltransferase